MMTPREENLQVLADARKWLRWLYTDGPYEKIDAIGVDQVHDVVLRIETFIEQFREGKCGV